MIFSELTTNERILLRKCSEVMLESLERLAKDSHEEFEKLIRDWDGEIDNLYIGLEILSQLDIWEEIKANPETTINRLTAKDLVILKLVLTQAVNSHRVPKSTKTLANRIENLISLHNTNLN